MKADEYAVLPVDLAPVVIALRVHLFMPIIALLDNFLSKRTYSVLGYNDRYIMSGLINR